MRKSKLSSKGTRRATNDDKLSKLEKAVAVDVAFERKVKKYHHKVPIEERAKTHKEIRKMIGYREDGQDPSVFWQKVLTRKARFQVRTHRGTYVAALAEAMKVYEYVCSLHFSKFIEHVKALCELNGTDPAKKKFSLLRLVLMNVIDYRCQLKRKKFAIDSHDLSRDTLAISWIISKGVRSDGLIAYHRKFGGGVDKWSRLASRKAGSDGSSSAGGLTVGSAKGSVGHVGSMNARAAAGNAGPQTTNPTGGGSQQSVASASPQAGQSKPRATPPARSEILQLLAACYKLEATEDLVVHLRGASQEPGFVLVGAAKVTYSGRLGQRRARARRLERRIRTATALDAQNLRTRV